MGKLTNISWTDHTFSIAWGCTKVSPGCQNCYADTLSARWGHDVWGPKKPRRVFGMNHWREPLRWNAAAMSENRRHRVFCSSMCDIFEAHPTVQAELVKLWALIRVTPWLTWQLLTKRPERIIQSLPVDWGMGYPNVWIGTSVENQEYANLRVPEILKVRAKVKFLSAEPLLGPIIFDHALGYCCTSDFSSKFGSAGIGWVIFGGESGHGHRKMDPKWVESGVSQCRAAGVAPFVKQDSGPKPGCQGRLSEALFSIKEFPIS